MSITLNPELEAKLRARAEEQGSSVESYVERLILIDDATRDRLEQLAVEGLESGEPVEGDEAFWEERHRKLNDHVKSMGTRRS